MLRISLPFNIQIYSSNWALRNPKTMYVLRFQTFIFEEPAIVFYQPSIQQPG